MLKGILIIVNVIIIVIRVSKEFVAFYKDKYTAYVLAWQKCLGRVFNSKYILCLVGKALALFVP